VQRKKYIIPVVEKIDLDYSITLQMQTIPNPTDPPPRTDSSGERSEPFASPFGDKPFS